jgi:hypothetical protein
LIAGIRDIWHHTWHEAQFFFLRRGVWDSWWAQNDLDLKNAGITGMCHHTWLKHKIFNFVITITSFHTCW